MDLYDLTLRDTYRHQIQHPKTRKPVHHTDGSPQWIELVGSDTKQYRNALAEVARMGISDPAEQLSAFLALITTAWHIVADGKTPELKDARQVYLKLPGWLRDELYGAAADRANFFAETSTGS